jgi:hypothetical protein
VCGSTKRHDGFSSPEIKYMKKIDKNCICTEWDGKGWSVCGCPCPVHNKLTKAELKKVFDKRKKIIQKFADDIKKGKIKETKIDF